MLIFSLINVLILISSIYGDRIQKIIEVRLNGNVQLECANMTAKQLPKGYEFKYSYYNASIHDIEKYELSEFELLELFDDTKLQTSNLPFIENAQYNNSGRYYCIFTSPNESDLFIITSILFVVYDIEDIMAKVHETVFLQANEIDSNISNIKWYYSRGYANVTYLDLLDTEYVKLNNSSNQVQIQVNKSVVTGTYRAQNTYNGAYTLYFVYCHGSSGYKPPIISPSNSSVFVGDDQTFDCANKNFYEPVNYFWYKVISDPRNDYTKVSLMYNGEILELKNINKTNHGWHMCCLIYRDSDNTEDTACTSVYLNVKKRLHDFRSWQFILLVTVFSLVLLFAFTLLIWFLYKKLVVLKDAQEGSKHMYKNEFYHLRSGFTPTFSINTQESDSKQTGLIYNDGFSQIQLRLTKMDIDKWNIPIDSLKFGSVLGKGAFGVVMYGEHFQKNTENDLTTKSSVAIKKLKENASRNNLDDLFEELHTMMQVGHHKNIINLIGFSFDTSLYIVTEFAKYGNLKDYIRKYDELSTQKIHQVYLLLFSYQIADGMEYLHTKKVLHRDLAARNILVAEHNLVKIADFGLARNIRSDYYYVQQADGRFPIKWMAPEALTYNKISKKSDIWSYGILLWEIYSHGCSPYPSIPPEQTLKLITSGYRLDRPSECNVDIYKQILSCWNMNPKSRPNFTKLKLELQILLEIMNKNHTSPLTIDFESNDTTKNRNQNDTTTSTNLSTLNGYDSDDEYNDNDLIDNHKKHLLIHHAETSAQNSSSVCTSIPSSVSSCALTDSMADCDVHKSQHPSNTSNDLISVQYTNSIETKPFLDDNTIKLLHDDSDVQHVNQTSTRESSLAQTIKRAFSFRNSSKDSSLNRNLFDSSRKNNFIAQV